MQEMPIQSAITNIIHSDDNIIIEGYAWTGSGNEIDTVEISFDGNRWIPVSLNKSLNKNQKSWAWTLWNIELPYDGEDKVMCRATDINGNRQPMDIKDKWNIRGLNNNSIHKKKIG